MVIITGPNMAGKSTYMRQVALIVLHGAYRLLCPGQESANIAHRGPHFHPRRARRTICAGGQSTFMVEMSEMANILRNATTKQPA